MPDTPYFGELSLPCGCSVSQRRGGVLYPDFSAFSVFTHATYTAFLQLTQRLKGYCVLEEEAEERKKKQSDQTSAMGHPYCI